MTEELTAEERANLTCSGPYPRNIAKALRCLDAALARAEAAEKTLAARNAPGPEIVQDPAMDGGFLVRQRVLSADNEAHVRRCYDAESALAEATALLEIRVNRQEELEQQVHALRGELELLTCNVGAPECPECTFLSRTPAPAAKAEPERPHCGQHAGWRSDCEECALHVAVSAPTLFERIEAVVNVGQCVCCVHLRHLIRASKAGGA
jgi:hypothetical protein